MRFIPALRTPVARPILALAVPLLGCIVGCGSSGASSTHGGGSGGSSSVMDGGTGTGGSTGTGMSDGGTGDGATPGKCSATHKIALGVTDATLSGDWTLFPNYPGEGTVAVLNLMGNGAVAGTVLWKVAIPCADTWHIWVRLPVDSTYNSFKVRLDGAPTPPAIFEANCSGTGFGFVWEQLSYRDLAAPACMHKYDPWTGNFAAGDHTFEVAYNTDETVARIIVSNDPSFTPGPSD